MFRLVGGFLSLTPDFCFVVEDDVGLVGYALAAMDSKQFHKKLEIAWLPEMCRKYPQPEKRTGETLSSTEVNKVYVVGTTLVPGVPRCSCARACHF
jgi:protein O-GlcNAcase/histone acetyltransferase